MQPGIYDISIDAYHKSEGISRSGLMTFKRTPYHYWHKYINPEYVPELPTPALVFGNAVHTYILEKDEFFNRHFVPPSVDRRTKEGKGEWAKVEAQSRGKIPIDQAMMNKIEKISKSLMQNEQASGLIYDAKYEKSIYWNDPDTGLLCKVRPDIWHENMIGDLKTTLNASYREFQRAIYSYGYHIQAGMIHEALRHTLGIEMWNFINLALEKDEPYAHAIYKLDEAAIAQGIVDFKNLLVSFKTCMDANSWPMYPTQTISLPAYAAYESQPM